jgi:carboxylesterase
MSYIVPGSEPFFLPGGATGCLLLHGFSAMPEEMRPLGEYLAEKGFTVLGIRLAGHATHPNDLRHTHWTDWLENVEDGLALFTKTCTKRVLIGQSLDGMIALIAAACYYVSGVVGLSTPYGSSTGERLSDVLRRLMRLMIRNPVKRFPPDHPLYHRRQLNYPAYPEVPSRILTELDRLASAMLAALPQVRVPALLFHSHEDHSVPFTCMQSIYDHLGSPHKEMLPLEGMDHSLVLDPKRQVVFEAVEKFLTVIIG